MSLSGTTALVTGASRGFGFAAARALASEGAQVIALARTVGGLEELDDRIREAGGLSPVLVPLDITDDPGLERMGAALHGRFGKLDLWLHTAAHAPPLAPAEHIAAKDLDKVIAVDIRAFQRLIRVLDPLLRLAGGSARALIAAEDRAGAPFFGAYAAAKAAQSAITRAWAAEAAREIAVAEIVPPPMPTALRARFYPGQDAAALTPIEEAAALLLPVLAGPIAPGERRLLQPARHAAAPLPPGS
ncbi:MAG: SDR family oxidoreductase [Pseudomonadota bacterium]